MPCVTGVLKVLNFGECALCHWSFKVGLPASSDLQYFNWPTLNFLCEVLDLHRICGVWLAGRCAVCHWSFKMV